MGVDEYAAAQMDFGHVVDALRGLIWITGADDQRAFANRSWHEYTGHDSH